MSKSLSEKPLHAFRDDKASRTGSKEFGILFDYNGVLADDEALHEVAAARAIAPYGVSLTTQAYREHCLGYNDRTGFGNLKRVFPIELHQPSINELMAARLRHYQQLAAQQSVLYPAATYVLKDLAAVFQLGLVTSSWRTEVEPPLAAAGVADFFKVMITLDDITHGKPDPEGYLKGLAALGLPAECVVVVEDSASGVSAAKAAGIKTIALLHTTPREALAHADHIFASLSDLTPALVQLLL